MTIEELNVLLKELSSDELTTDRQLEIFSAIRSDKEKSIKDMTDLTNNTAKLQEDYDKLKKKTVDDFFNYGTQSEEAKKEAESDDHKDDTEIPKETTVDDFIMSDEEMANIA